MCRVSVPPVVYQQNRFLSWADTGSCQTRISRRSHSIVHWTDAVAFRGRWNSCLKPCLDAKGLIASRGALDSSSDILGSEDNIHECVHKNPCSTSSHGWWVWEKEHPVWEHCLFCGKLLLLPIVESFVTLVLRLYSQLGIYVSMNKYSYPVPSGSNSSGTSLRVRVRAQTEPFADWQPGLSIIANRRLGSGSMPNSQPIWIGRVVSRSPSGSIHRFN